MSLILALDDLLTIWDSGTQLYAPLDWKTKGQEPKDDGAQYYQTQLDVYALALRECHFQPTGKGYLAYWWPTLFKPARLGEIETDAIEFNVQVYELEANADRAVKLIDRAVLILKAKNRPAAEASCEYCRYGDRLTEMAIMASKEPDKEAVG